MPNCCICYTTDQGYLLPTLVSAVQARRNSSLHKTDVAIFGFCNDSKTERLFSAICALENIRFFPTPLAAIEGASAMLARLFLTSIAPAEYDHFLYIDGDTQVAGSLDPLIDLEVPAGKFLAASDPMAFEISGSGRHNRKIIDYFSSIGISGSRAANYFNSGVMRINRDGWAELGREAWKLSRRMASRFPDQDALNIVGGSARIPMSLAWNFPIFLRNSGVETNIKPKVYHFMGSPKPWQGSFLPWGSMVFKPYLDIVKQYPELQAYLLAMPAPTRIRYYLQQHYKKGIETVTWGLSEKRMRILHYESRLSLAGIESI